MASVRDGPNTLALKTQIIPYMTRGHLRVTIGLHRDGRKLPLLKQRSKVYAVASPDEEFQVHCERAARLHFTDLITIKIDGQGIGYGSLMTQGIASATMDYMVGAPGHRPDECVRFKFVKQQPGNASNAVQVNNPDDIKTGRINVVVHDAYPDNKPALFQSATTTRQQAPVETLPEGKKFFMAPSLGCGTGASCGTIRWNTVSYESRTQLGEVTIHYETAATLVLRNVLDAAIPEHKAIIQEYGMQPAAAAPARAGGGNAQGNIPDMFRAQQQRKKSKRDGSKPAASRAGNGNASLAVGVKRERDNNDGGDVPASSRQAAGQNSGKRDQTSKPIIVDLTEAEPLKVNGQVLGKDQMAVCDLTSEQQGRPGSWQVVAKVKEEVQIDEV